MKSGTIIIKNKKERKNCVKETRESERPRKKGPCGCPPLLGWAEQPRTASTRPPRPLSCLLRPQSYRLRRHPVRGALSVACSELPPPPLDARCRGFYRSLRRRRARTRYSHPFSALPSVRNRAPNP